MQIAYNKLIQTVLVVLAIAFFSMQVQTASAIEIKQVKSDKGIKALLVEDYTLPIIALSFSIEGGSTQDEIGKEGTLRLMTALMDEGAGDLDNIAFQSILEEQGISINFSSSRDNFSGSMRMLRDDRDQAFELMHLALTKPRFDETAIERMRDAIRTGIIRSKTNPGANAAKALRETLFPGHLYNRSHRGNETSIDAITREDIVTMNEKILTRENLFVGVVGAISEDELKTVLDTLFGDMPEKSRIEVIEDIAPKTGQTIELEMPVPNVSISLAYNGIKRDDPDFFAAHLMNHILGGGSFSSRLYEEIREKRGLVYGVNSGIATFDHSAYLTARTSTRPENRDETLSLIKEEVLKIVRDGVTEEELEKAKKFVAGSYAINNLDTSGKIAGVLVALQSEALGIDYIETREKQIAAVTLDDIRRVAKRLLDVEPTTVIVGPATQ